MLIADILTLRSPILAPSTVADVLPFLKVDDEFFTTLRARMQETGVCAVPVCVRDGYLLDGHHRVKLSVLLGWYELPVTDLEGESGCSFPRTVV